MEFSWWSLRLRLEEGGQGIVTRWGVEIRWLAGGNERVQVHQVRHRRWRCCRQNLHADIVHQQYLPYGESPFRNLRFHFVNFRFDFREIWLFFMFAQVLWWIFLEEDRCISISLGKEKKNVFFQFKAFYFFSLIFLWTLSDAMLLAKWRIFLMKLCFWLWNVTSIMGFQLIVFGSAWSLHINYNLLIFIPKSSFQEFIIKCVEVTIISQFQNSWDSLCVHALDTPKDITFLEI